MKLSIIFFALMTIFGLSGISNAQSGTFTLTFKGQTTYDGSHSLTVNFTGLENTNVRLLEAVFPVVPGTVCSEKADMSGARIVGSDRATLSYDRSTGVYSLNWLHPDDTADTCRILIGDGDVDGADFIVWRNALGSTAGFGSEKSGQQDETSSATIRVHYNTGFGNRITIRSSAPPQWED